MHESINSEDAPVEKQDGDFYEQDDDCVCDDGGCELPLVVGVDERYGGDVIEMFSEAVI